ncbi:MAG: phosphoenolpyruvate--protein phosphotransferase, partial [Actinomycetota bacterium]
MNNFSGIGVSPGVVVGPIRRIIQETSNDPIPATPRQIFDALEQVASDLEKRAESIELEIAKDVLAAQAMMARDPALVEVISSRLDQDILYEDIRKETLESFDGFKAALSALGGYFAERVADLDEIAHRLLAKLSGTEAEDLVLTSPSIIVAEDLTPSDTASLN